MGEIIADHDQQLLLLFSDIVLYGSASSPALAQQVARDIEQAWNEAKGLVRLNGRPYALRFSIRGYCRPETEPEEVWYNDNPKKNYFRVEPYAEGNISYVDGIGSNTGYFKYDNLINASTTAAHEYGHTLGLIHPRQLDIRGQGRPGIMYPRGTLVDPPYQYDPHAAAGAAGGTLHPRHRRVLAKDIALLKLEQLLFRDNKATVGAFTSIYHEAELPPATAQMA